MDDFALEMYNLVDIRAERDFELVMRLNTDIKNEDFYTDLNGFQVVSIAPLSAACTYSTLIRLNDYTSPCQIGIEADHPQQFSDANILEWWTIYAVDQFGVCILIAIG